MRKIHPLLADLAQAVIDEEEVYVAILRKQWMFIDCPYYSAEAEEPSELELLRELCGYAASALRIFDKTRDFRLERDLRAASVGKYDGKTDTGVDIPSEPKGETIEVEIALGVEPEGLWEAHGAEWCSWDGSVSQVGLLRFSTIYRLRARVPVPKVQEIEAEVEAVEGEE